MLERLKVVLRGCVGESALNGNCVVSLNNAIDRHWNRKALSRLSSVMCVMRIPSSPRNSMPSLFMAPMVSAAIGINEYDCVNEAYYYYYYYFYYY